MRQWLVGILSILFIAGCNNIPFQKTSYVPLESVVPLTVLKQFKNRVPENFQLLNTIVFKYNWNKFSAVGYIDINTREKLFTVVCINPMGIKLFELSGNKDGVTQHFALEEFTRKGNLASTVGEDIKRIYFDLVPSSEAKIKKEKNQIIFSQPLGAGMIEYVFAGSDGYLIEKNYYNDNELSWRVSFYEYQQKNGKIYPGGVILKNYKYKYSLTVKLKEIID